MEHGAQAGAGVPVMLAIAVAVWATEVAVELPP